MIAKTKVVDLFCGIGGLSHGFHREGFDVSAGFDIDGSCEYAYEKNNSAKFIVADVASLETKTVQDMFDGAETRILVGCAPCQPFSTYNTKKGAGGKWNLLSRFGNLIEEISPEIVSMENVPNIVNFKRYPVYESFLAVLRNNGYHVDAKVVYCPDYGIPQKRKRLVLLASKLGPIELMGPTHRPEEYVTVEDAIGHLPPIADGETDPNDPVHRARKLSPINKKRIRITREGEGWQNWPEELKLSCHKKNSGKSYKNVYGRMKRDEPAPTLTTYCTGLGNGMFGHYEQDRAISAREAAILQTFPEHYEFFPPEERMRMDRVSRQIGNAVPVRLGEIIAKSIRRHLERTSDHDPVEKRNQTIEVRV